VFESWPEPAMVSDHLRVAKTAGKIGVLLGTSFDLKRFEKRVSVIGTSPKKIEAGATNSTQPPRQKD